MNSYYTETSTLEIWGETHDGTQQKVETFTGYWEEAKERIEALMDETNEYRSMWIEL